MTTEQDVQAMKHRQEEGQRPKTYTLSRASAFGVLGSLAGMLAMDVVIVVESLMMGLPATSYLALIGSVLGGDALVGVAMHLVMGSLLGLVFAAAVYYVELLRINTLWKGVWLGVLAGLVTIPFGCVPFAIVTGVPILFMVGFSFIPHLVWGVVLGLVAGLGLHSDTRSAAASTAN